MSREVRTDLAAEPREVSRARRILADQLPSWGVHGDDADVALLLTSELVTNAIEHGRGPVVLQAGLQAGRLRVEISDTDTSMIHQHSPGLDADRGRGLYLVDALADTWGADHTPQGKRVWFELRRA